MRIDCSLITLIEFAGRKHLRFTLTLSDTETEAAFDVKGCLVGRDKDGNLWARPWGGCRNCQRFKSLGWNKTMEAAVLRLLDKGGWLKQL